MAKVASDSLEATQQPQLSLQAIDFMQAKIGGPHANAGQLGAQLTLQLKNPGHVRIVYDIEVADAIINGAPIPNGPYDNHVGVIFPGDIHAFRLPALPVAQPFPSGATGTLKFRVKYWFNERRRFSLECTVAFVISNDVKWAYQSGPKYAYVLRCSGRRVSSLRLQGLQEI